MATSRQPHLVVSDGVPVACVGGHSSNPRSPSTNGIFHSNPHTGNPRMDSTWMDCKVVSFELP
jgi:hypothetical protein